jgi:hypothetical protein
MPHTASIDFATLATLDPLPDDELERLALEADPDMPIAAGAPSLWELAGVTASTLLPAWYMPAAHTVHTGRRWRRAAAVVAIAAFVGINATGLCSTYGWVSFG